MLCDFNLCGAIICLVLQFFASCAYFTCAITNHWIYVGDKQMHYGLWESCVKEYGITTCMGIDEQHEENFVTYVRVLIVVALILSVVSWILVLMLLIYALFDPDWLWFFKDKEKYYFTMSTSLYVITGILVIIGTVWYKFETDGIFSSGKFNYVMGYSIIIGLVASPIGIISSVLLTVFIHRFYGNNCCC